MEVMAVNGPPCHSAVVLSSPLLPLLCILSTSFPLSSIIGSIPSLLPPPFLIFSSYLLPSLVPPYVTPQSPGV